MNNRNVEWVFQGLLWATALGAIVGLGLLISHASRSELALFEFITFGFSLVAVTLAIVGSMTSLRQSRTMERISREMRATLKELQEIDHDNELIKRKIQIDHKLAQEIAESLASMGVNAKRGK